MFLLKGDSKNEFNLVGYVLFQTDYNQKLHIVIVHLHIDHIYKLHNQIAHQNFDHEIRLSFHYAMFLYW